MNPTRIMAVVLRIAYLIRGSFSRIVPIFAWVAVDMILWGFITKYFGQHMSPQVALVPALLGAVLFWDFMTRIMQGVTTTFFEDVWSRNFLNMFTSPLTIGEYLSGLVVSSIATGAIGLVVMAVLATLVFGLTFATYGFLVIPFMLVLFLFGIALGILSSALVLRLGPAAEWFIWPIPALLSPLAGVYYPLSTLPKWMQLLAHGLPPAYVFESLRAIVDGKATSTGTLAIGAGLSVLYVLLACLVFVLTYRYAVNTGLFGRYSAENVT